MTYLDVVDAVAAVLAGAWPERTVYRDVCPSDFQRPSFFLQVAQAVPTDANAGLVQWELTLALELFDEMDDYYVQSSERLMLVQQSVLALFAPGWIRAVGRAVTMTAAALGREPGEAAVELKATWFAPRETMPVPVPPMAERYKVGTVVRVGMRGERTHQTSVRTGQLPS